MWPFCANRLLKRALKKMMVSPCGLQSISKHVYKFCNISGFSSSLSTSFTASQFRIKRRNAATMFSYIFPKLAAQHPRSASMPEAERYNVISQFIWYALS
jgi:hypothetical protein